MKATLAGIAGIITGAAGALLARRYVGAFLWWLFSRGDQP